MYFDTLSAKSSVFPTSTAAGWDCLDSAWLCLEMEFMVCLFLTPFLKWVLLFLRWDAFLTGGSVIFEEGKSVFREVFFNWYMIIKPSFCRIFFFTESTQFIIELHVHTDGFIELEQIWGGGWGRDRCSLIGWTAGWLPWIRTGEIGLFSFWGSALHVHTHSKPAAPQT